MKRKTMKDPVTFTLRIEEEIYNKLLKEAEDKGVSVSAVMRWAVVAYFKEGEEQ